METPTPEALTPESSVLEPLLLLAVDPALQGIYVWEPAAHEATVPLARLIHGLTGRRPVRIPATVAPEQLEDRWDMQQTLAHGKPVRQPGFVKRAREGGLLIEAAHLLAVPAAARLVSLIQEQAPEARPLLVARAAQQPQRSEPLAAHCALWLEWQPFSPRTSRRAAVAAEALEVAWAEPVAVLRQRIAAARRRATGIPLPDHLLENVCRRVAEAGGDPPLDFFVLRTARARAAWHGRSEIDVEDVEAAWSWVAAPRLAAAVAAATQPSDQSLEANAKLRTQDSPRTGPPDAQTILDADTTKPGGEADGPGEPSTVQPKEHSSEHPGEHAEGLSTEPSPYPGAPSGDPGRRSRETGAASQNEETPKVVVVPAAALGGVLALTAPAGATPFRRNPRRREQGRPTSRSSPRRNGSSLALAATLLAALPYQRLRPPRPPLKTTIFPEDLRWRHPRPRRPALYILAVDGSGSMAQGRMQLAKGAALSVLQGAYRERRFVALVDFRHRSAQVLSPPGRSGTLIRRQIGALPSGGGTPLPAALALSRRLVQRWRLRHPDGPATLVLFTDGKANVPLESKDGPAKKTDGPPTEGAVMIQDHRRQARADVERLARLLKADHVSCVVIDTNPPGTAEMLHHLARSLGAAIIRLSPRRP